MGSTCRLTSGKLIRAARKKMGLSQVEVANLADVSRRTVQHAETGKNSVKVASLRAIGDVVHVDLHDDTTSIEDAPISNVASFGYLPFRMFKFASAQISAKELAYCHCEREFLLVLEIMWRNFQWELANLPPSITLPLVEFHPQFCSMKGYFERYMGIWKANPLAFGFSSTKGQRTGVSVILPVAQPTYQQFVIGHKSYVDIGANEVVQESPTLIYETMSLFFDSRQRPHSLGGTLAFVAFDQLSRLLPYVRTHVCEVATLAAEPENVEKMRNSGFKPIGTKIPNLNYPIWHASNRPDFGSDEDEAIRSSTFGHFLSLRQRSQAFKAKLGFGVVGALQANRLAKRPSVMRDRVA